MGTKVQHRKEYAPIPALLRAMREEAGLSQRDLAKALDVNSQTQIQYSETKSRRVDLAEFVAWAKACHIPPEDALKRYLVQAYPSTTKGRYPAHIERPLSAHEGPAQEDRERKVASLLEEAAALLKKDRRKGARTRKK